jgi:hypothetical protein
MWNTWVLKDSLLELPLGFLRKFVPQLSYISCALVADIWCCRTYGLLQALKKVEDERAIHIALPFLSTSLEASDVLIIVQIIIRDDLILELVCVCPHNHTHSILVLHLPSLVTLSVKIVPPMA